MALIVLVNSGEIKSDRGVQVLEKDTFRTFVNDNKHVLVQFCELTEREKQHVFHILVQIIIAKKVVVICLEKSHAHH